MNKPKNRLSALAQWSCSVLLLAATVNAESNAGMTRRKVRDRAGAAVRGATVRLTNSITKYAQTTVTDNEGAYQLIDAPFNRYTLTVEAGGVGLARQEGVVAANLAPRVHCPLQGAPIPPAGHVA